MSSWADLCTMGVVVFGVLGVVWLTRWR